MRIQPRDERASRAELALLCNRHQQGARRSFFPGSDRQSALCFQLDHDGGTAVVRGLQWPEPGWFDQQAFRSRRVGYTECRL